MRQFEHLLPLALLLSTLCVTIPAAVPSAADTSFTTPLLVDNLDPAAFAAWVDGAEQPLLLKDGPRHVVWTQTTAPEWDGVKFGESKTSGARHLRLAWKSPLALGTVLARAGGRLSVLKPEAAYPGRLDNDADWLSARRIKEGRISTDEADKEDFVWWILPPSISTRALRFTHVSETTDKTYHGWLGGAYVMNGRWANVAPEAIVTASQSSEKAAKLNNSSNDGTWSAWNNAPDTNAPLVSTEHPVWITLTWPQAIKLRGLNALWAGFSAATVQSFTGPADRHPREAREADWFTVRSFDRVENQYPRALGVNWLDFGREVTTRAVRLAITRCIDENRAHGHLKGNTKNGRRVWLGELQALQPLGAADLASVIGAPTAAGVTQPPIAVRFTQPETGLVTLVIETASGQRVRNLVSETPFPAGENIAWWDGTDDLLRDPAAARHGLYHIPAQFVQPGAYQVRGLWHKPIDLRYEFSLYNAGQPAWETADATGAWLANHTPPCAALFVPGTKGTPSGKDLVFLGSYVSEGGHGLAWVDLAGRKIGGVGWVGGNWTGAPYLARDDGPQADTNTFAYAAAAWSDDEAAKKTKLKAGEIRLTALTPGGHKPVVKYPFTLPLTNTARVEWSECIGGCAACDGLLVASLTRLDQLLFVDAKAKKFVGAADLAAPRGLAFALTGRKWLYAVSGRKLLRFDCSRMMLVTEKNLLPPPEALIVESQLEDPRQLTLDSSGNIYISDRGNSHQVKVFSPAGKFLRAIGKPGAPKAGPYDPLHLNNPDGLTIDSLNRLWVTENDYQPKRVSVWTLDGKLVRAYYGPGEYGGGGKLDPEDATRFYYHGMEFRLDWARGADQLVSVFYRPGPGDLAPPDGYGSTGLPEQPHYVQGRRYWANDHNSNPTGGPGLAMLWLDVKGLARPVAALGRAHDWKLLKGEAFKSRWPTGVNLLGDYWQNATLFVWSDLNGDAQVQPEEVMMQKATVGSVTVAPDLSWVVSRVGANAMRYPVWRFSRGGVPVYDLAQGQILATGTQGPASSGGDQALWHAQGWTILTTPPKPFSPYSVGAVFQGVPRWSYPSPWPGLHASHESPPPSFPGMVIGTTRLLGDFITPRGGDAGPVWCLNGNQGNLYLFTADGLFVAELFKDVRRGPTWSMPTAQRGMRLNNLTLHDENFWPSITQTKDGRVYLVDGARTSLVRVDGLETIRRLPATTLIVTTNDLAKARAYFLEAEAARQKSQGRGSLKVALRTVAPMVDGQLDDWAGADWVDIDKTGVAAYFDSNSKPYDVRAALAIAGDRIYAAYRTGDKDLLRNSGEMPKALFKTGGALDLMLGANSAADLQRSTPVAGDLRLLVTQVKGRAMAVLYRPVALGATEPAPFSSPWRTITFDQVEDVSAQIQLAGTNGNFEISFPLAVLGLKPVAGQRIKGDIGILRGNGFQTVQRVYWSNKASGITADVPSEAELTPKLWGIWEF